MRRSSHLESRGDRHAATTDNGAAQRRRAARVAGRHTDDYRPWWPRWTTTSWLRGLGPTARSPLRAHGGGLRLREGRLAGQGLATHSRRAARARAAPRSPLDDRACHRRERGLLRLHEHHGFVRVGHEREVAVKLGRWLDVLTSSACYSAVKPGRPSIGESSAPRLRRGATSAGGFGGHLGAPSQTVIEARPGFAGRDEWGLGGHVGAPTVGKLPGCLLTRGCPRPARVPSSRLPLVLVRPARLADRDVDAVGGAAWLVLELTNSPFRLGLWARCHSRDARAVVLAGALADRCQAPPRMVSQSVLFAQALLLAVLVQLATSSTGRRGAGPVYGVANTVDMPTRQRYRRDGGRDDLMNAIALNSAMFNAARIVVRAGRLRHRALGDAAAFS